MLFCILRIKLCGTCHKNIFMKGLTLQLAQHDLAMSNIFLEQHSCQSILGQPTPKIREK